jgi:hypothetical protein
MTQILCDCCGKIILDSVIERRKMDITAPQLKSFKPITFDLCLECTELVLAAVESRGGNR